MTQEKTTIANKALLLLILFLIIGNFALPSRAADSILGKWYMDYPGLSSIKVEAGDIEIVESNNRIIFWSRLCIENEEADTHSLKKWVGTYNNNVLRATASCTAPYTLGGARCVEKFKYQLEAHLRPDTTMRGLLYVKSEDVCRDENGTDRNVSDDYHTVEFTRCINCD